MNDLLVFCADVGSVKMGNFGWACSASHRSGDVGHDSSSPDHLADAVAEALSAGRPVALGFECPLFVPVPSASSALGAGRGGEGNRPWSAGAGSGALATGLVQAAWVLRAVRERCPEPQLHLDWQGFSAEQQGLFIWEAFVSAHAKGATHVDDATIAVNAFLRALPDPTSASTITAERPLSLIGGAALWSGWLDDGNALHGSPLVIRA